MDQRLAVQQRALYGALARQVHGPFEVPDMSGVAVRLLDVTARGLAAELVDREESYDEKELADEGRSGRSVRLPICGLAAGVHHPVPLC